MAQTILLAANTENLGNLVNDYFAQAGYRVVTAVTGNQALTAIQANNPDLIILDEKLPDMDNGQFMHQCQIGTEIPIILLTNGSADERITGLEQGADDTITKPCSMRELAARARAVLRRIGKAAPQAEVLQLHDIVLDRNGRYVQVGSKCVDLTPSEFDLLAIMLASPGHVFSREDFLDLLRGVSFNECERTIDVHIRNLRNKIEADPRHPRYVQTVYGYGYRFAADI